MTLQQSNSNQNFNFNSNNSKEREFIANVPEDKNFSITSLVSFKNARILVVEDNEINLKMLLKVLEHSKMSIKTAKNGREALEVLAGLNRDELDLILMDINMPVMDGYRATTLIREDSKWQDIPIIALSALNLEQEIKKMKDVGMDAFLSKPLNLKQLYTVFKMYLKDLHIDKKTSSHDPKLDKLQLPEIDLKSALNGVGDDVDILKDIMSQFRSDYRNSDKKIEFYIQINDTKMLQKTLIDLIGLSGNIGAKKLFAISKELYKDFIFSKFDDILIKLPDFSRTLKIVCESIDKFLDEV
jgi:CheY-like chemotaxis protein